MSGIFVVCARRTPFDSSGGSLAAVPAAQMAFQDIQFILSETGLPAELIDEVIIGQVLQGDSGQASSGRQCVCPGFRDVSG